MVFRYLRAFFEIPKFDQVISSPKVAQIGSIGSYIINRIKPVMSNSRRFIRGEVARRAAEAFDAGERLRARRDEEKG